MTSIPASAGAIHGTTTSHADARTMAPHARTAAAMARAAHASSDARSARARWTRRMRQTGAKGRETRAERRHDVGTSGGAMPRMASRARNVRADASVDDDVHARTDAASTSGAQTPAVPALQLQLSPGAGASPGAFGSSSRVMDFVAAWDAINPRLAEHGEVNKEMLLSALTLAIPRLQQIPAGGGKEDAGGGGKPAHERAVDVTLTLVDLGMDAECISAGLLREAVVHGTVTLEEIEALLGEGVMKLAHDVGRVHDLPRRVHSYDEESAERLRSFYLSFHDIRAIVVELACRLDVLRHADEYPPIQRTTLALETMQIYAPMAHALNTGTLCAELEDLAFKILFPTSYASLEHWLASNSPADSAVLDRTSKIMADAMNSDPTLNALVGRGGVKVLARRKSRYSTMKKIIRDGRKREQVHDLLGMRLILTPQPGSAAEMPDVGEVSDVEDAEARALKAANAACYRAQQLAHSMFPAVSGRTKDYVSSPKPNGYSSLHSTLRVAFDANGKPLSMNDALKQGANVELQIRTCAMHIAAEAGAASHTSYKGGLKEDTGMVRSLADLATAANRAAEEKFGSFMHSDLRTRGANHDRLFDTFDLNGDGRVTIAELRQALSAIWNTEEESQLRAEADALMTLLDVNDDGTIDPNEFTKFRASLTAISALPKADAETLAAIEAVALETDEDVAVESQTVDAEDAVIDVDVVPTGDKLEVEAELIATVREAVNSSYEYVGKSDAAARKAAAAMRDTNPTPIEWQLVWDLMKSGRAETARQLFYQRTTRTPSEIETWEQWARFELLQGDPERARGLYRAALLHCVDTPLVRAETLRKWAMMELSSTDALHATSAPDLFSRAIAVVAEASADGKITKEESGKAQAKVYHTWSQGASRRGDIAQARTLLDKAEELDAGNPAVAHARGQIEEACGNVGAAIAAYAMGAATNPTDPFLIQSWARLEAKTGRLANARALYKRGVQAHPDNHHLAQAWAVSESKHRDGDSSIAREQFQRASSLAPWSVHTWSAWARFEAFAENNTQSIETALALYARGLEVERGNVVCLIGLAECQSRLGRFDAARDVLSIAQRAHPDHFGVVFEMAKLEERAGQPAKAIHLYARAKEMKRAFRARAPSTASRGKTSTWSPLERLERDERTSRSAAVISAAAVVDALRLAADADAIDADADADAEAIDADARASRTRPRAPPPRRRRRYADTHTDTHTDAPS